MRIIAGGNVTAREVARAVVTRFASDIGPSSWRCRRSRRVAARWTRRRSRPPPRPSTGEPDHRRRHRRRQAPGRRWPPSTVRRWPSCSSSSRPSTGRSRCSASDATGRSAGCSPRRSRPRPSSSVARSPGWSSGIVAMSTMVVATTLLVHAQLGPAGARRHPRHRGGRRRDRHLYPRLHAREDRRAGRWSQRDRGHQPGRHRRCLHPAEPGARAARADRAASRPTPGSCGRSTRWPVADPRARRDPAIGHRARGDGPRDRRDRARSRSPRAGAGMKALDIARINIVRTFARPDEPVLHRSSCR